MLIQVALAEVTSANTGKRSVVRNNPLALASVEVEWPGRSKRSHQPCLPSGLGRSVFSVYIPRKQPPQTICFLA